MIQGSAADLIKRAMLAVDRRIREAGMQARMLLQIHDELVFEAPDAEIPALAALVREAMTTALTFDVPLGVDVAAGPNWLDVEAIPGMDGRAAMRAPNSERLGDVGRCTGPRPYRINWNSVVRNPLRDHPPIPNDPQQGAPRRPPSGEGPDPTADPNSPDRPAFHPFRPRVPLDDRSDPIDGHALGLARDDHGPLRPPTPR